MKFLLLTVALVHCAFASNGNDSQAAGSQDPIVGGAQLLRMTKEEEKGAPSMRIGEYDIYHKEGCRVYKYAPVQEENGNGGLDDSIPEDQDIMKNIKITLISSEDENPMKFSFTCRDPITGNKLVDGYCSNCKSDEKPDANAVCTRCEAEGKWKSSSTGKNRQIVSTEFVKNTVGNDKTATDIKLTKVKGPVLREICDYLAFHNGMTVSEIAKPIRSPKMEIIVEHGWDATFINKHPKKMIFDIILGANYMDIKSLLHLGCAKIATLIKGKSPDEIKKILGDDGTCDPAGGNARVLCPKCKETLKDHEHDPDFVLELGCPECAKIQGRRRRLLGEAIAKAIC